MLENDMPGIFPNFPCMIHAEMLVIWLSGILVQILCMCLITSFFQQNFLDIVNNDTFYLNKHIIHIMFRTLFSLDPDDTFSLFFWLSGYDL